MSDGPRPLSQSTRSELGSQQTASDYAGHVAESSSESSIPQGANQIRVFLLDDHEIVRVGLKELLEAEPDIVVVGESGLAEEAARRIPALRPDVAILDVRLPDGSGIDVCREIRSRDPNIKALILTSYDDDEALFAAIMAGAAGYIAQAGARQRPRRGRTPRRCRPVDPGPGGHHGGSRPHSQRSAGGQGARALTDQEQKILDLIGEGLTNREIGERMFLAEKTIKNYVSAMLAKLGSSSRTQAAIFATKHQR